jgi:urease accessory protein UreF
MITNAVKLVPLGQLDGQDILFSLYSVMEKTVWETMELDRDMVGLCNTSLILNVCSMKGCIQGFICLKDSEKSKR